MVYFLFGPNSFLIKAKIDAVKKKFLIADPSNLNLAEIDGSGLDWPTFQGVVSTVPFLANRRLVIIKNLLLENQNNELKKKIAEAVPKIPQSTVVFFVEYGLPDARMTLFKTLNKTGAAEKFEQLENADFRRWVRERLIDNSAKMEPGAIQKLEIFVGGDLWRAENEIQKLSLYRKSLTPAGGEIVVTEKDVLPLVSQQIQSNIFDFIDALSGKNTEGAAAAVHKLLQDGKNELYILTMIVYQFRNMLVVSDLQAQGTAQADIAKKAKLHPFVVKKTLSTLRKFSQKDLETVYGLLFDIDFKIKSGQIAPDLAVWVLVEKICSY